MIAIVYIQDIKNCPFLDKYIDILDNLKLDYKIIYWNRNSKDNQGIVREGNTVEYRYYQDISKSKIQKIYGFIKFKLFLNNEIRKYNSLILLTTLSAFILVDKLNKYKKKYIFDFRDPSFENNFIFFKILSKIIINSYFTCISSLKFKDILIKNDYFMAHNFRYSDIVCSREREFLFRKKEKSSSLNIVYFGAIREFEHIKSQIQLFKNDKRFNIYYYGIGSDYLKLKEYIDNGEYNNIHLMGEYYNNEKYKFLEITDIINNHYPIINNYDICTSNKFYDCIIYKRPLLSNYKCIDHINSKKSGLGIGLKLENKNDLDKLYDWYHNIDERQFNLSSEKELKAIIEDDEKYLMKIKKFSELNR